MEEKECEMELQALMSRKKNERGERGVLSERGHCRCSLHSQAAPKAQGCLSGVYGAQPGWDRELTLGGVWGERRDRHTRHSTTGCGCEPKGKDLLSQGKDRAAGSLAVGEGAPGTQNGAQHHRGASQPSHRPQHGR